MTTEPDAETIDQAAAACSLGRSTIYIAMQADPAKRKGLPHLPSFKVGKARRIRREARLRWLAELESAAKAEAEAEAEAA